MILPIILAFGTILKQVMPSIRNLQKFSIFHRHAGPRHQNHRSWALKPLTTRFFTKSSLTVSTSEYSMSLSRSFLQMKAENQNFQQITRICLENGHLWSRINLCCKHKFTNVVLSLCWQISRLILWHFWSAYFAQHLPLQPSIEKRRKQSCTPNIYTNKWLILSENVTYILLKFDNIAWCLDICNQSN